MQERRDEKDKTMHDMTWPAACAGLVTLVQHTRASIEPLTRFPRWQHWAHYWHIVSNKKENGGQNSTRKYKARQDKTWLDWTRMRQGQGQRQEQGVISWKHKKWYPEWDFGNVRQDNKELALAFSWFALYCLLSCPVLSCLVILSSLLFSCLSCLPFQTHSWRHFSHPGDRTMKTPCTCDINKKY